MHQKRQSVTMKIPIARKGTTYVAQAKINPQNAVPVIIAIRDMLKLAKTAKEITLLIHEKKLKINGRIVKEPRESVQLFNHLEADKPYMLTYTENGRFAFESAPKDQTRLTKVTGKKMIAGKKIQIGLHDGTTMISKDAIAVGDSLYLDYSGKIKKHVTMEKGKSCIVIEGKYTGKKGTIESIKDKEVKVKLDSSKETVVLDTRRIIVQ